MTIMQSQLTVRITKMLAEIEQAMLSRNTSKAKTLATRVRDMIGKSANSNTAKMQRDELNSLMLGVSFSRIGAKMKFGMAEKVMRDGSVHLNFSEVREYLSKQTVDGLRYIVQDARAARDAGGNEGKKFNYYSDLVLAAQQELKKRGFSRPGVKAKFAIEDRFYFGKHGQPERFDASSLERGDFADASKSPMLGNLLSEKVMPEGGWRAVQVGSDTLVISFEDADLAQDFGRRAAGKGYSATSPVATTGRYWNVEVKNGK